jgi:hypothetical protein
LTKFNLLLTFLDFGELVLARVDQQLQIVHPGYRDRRMPPDQKQGIVRRLRSLR